MEKTFVNLASMRFLPYRSTKRYKNKTPNNMKRENNEIEKIIVIKAKPVKQEYVTNSFLFSLYLIKNKNKEQDNRIIG